MPTRRGASRDFPDAVPCSCGAPQVLGKESGAVAEPTLEFHVLEVAHDQNGTCAGGALGAPIDGHCRRRIRGDLRNHAADREGAGPPDIRIDSPFRVHLSESTRSLPCSNSKT